LGRFVKGGLGVPLLKITGRVKELYKLENGRDGGRERGRRERGRGKETLQTSLGDERRGGMDSRREAANLSYTPILTTPLLTPIPPSLLPSLVASQASTWCRP